MESYLKDLDINQLNNLLPTLDDNISDELSEIMSKHLSDKGYGLCNNFIINNKYLQMQYVIITHIFIISY